MHCSILVTSSQKFSGEVSSITLPGSDGRFQVLENHVDTVVLLKAGVIELEQSGKNSTSFLIDSGVVSFSSSEVTILADSCVEYNSDGISKITQEVDSLTERYESSKDDAEKIKIFNQLDALKQLAN